MSTPVALVACGGRGSRLGPLGQVVNKCLLPHRGVPMVVHVARDAFDRFGCTACVFLVDHLAEQVESVLPQYFPDADLQFLRTPPGAGTAISVHAALQTFRPEAFVYAHGNVALDADSLARVWQLSASGTMTAWAVSPADAAPTHPVVGAGRHAVGFGMNVGAPRTAPRSDETFEEWWLRDGRDVLHADIGYGWQHLEDLSFYG